MRILQYLKSSSRIREGEGFEEDIVAYIISETAKGLEYLHRSGLIHRDIKAGNILVDADGHVCIGDLGMVAKEGHRNSSSNRLCLAGTPCWMAPEAITRKHCHCQSDIWSLGITAMELYKGTPPLARFDNDEILQYTVNGEAPSLNSYTDAFPSNPSSAFDSWIHGVLRKDMRERYSIGRVLNHRWLQQAENGREALVTLLQSIPDLPIIESVEDLNSCIVWNERENAFMKDISWDFSLPPLKAVSTSD